MTPLSQPHLGKDATVTLDAPDTTGFVLISAEMDGRHEQPSEDKLLLIKQLKHRASQLRRDGFAQVGILTAVRIADVRTARRWTDAEDDGEPAGARPPRYDIAVLLQVDTIDAAHRLRTDPALLELEQAIGEAAKAVHVAVIHNVRRASCEYPRPGIRRLYVLMNYLAPDQRKLVPAWGWTKRFDLIMDVLFRRSLRGYIRAAFTGSGAATRATLYRLA